MSERSLFRLVPEETGMSFGRWRKQFQILLALERLSQGEAVQTVAFDLGYETSSAFITMFRKVLGASPARYLAARRDRARQEGRGHTRPGIGAGTDILDFLSI